MASTSKTTGHDGVLLMRDSLILALGIAKDACGIPPAQAAFASATAILMTIRVRSFPRSTRVTPGLMLIQDTMANQEDYIELG